MVYPEAGCCIHLHMVHTFVSSFPIRSALFYAVKTHKGDGLIMLVNILGSIRICYKMVDNKWKNGSNDPTVN